MSLDIAFVETLSKAPGVVARLGGEERKKQRCRIVARHGVKKIHLNLGQIVKSIIENPGELLEESRPRHLLDGRAVEVGLVRNRFFVTKLPKGLQ